MREGTKKWNIMKEVDMTFDQKNVVFLHDLYEQKINMKYGTYRNGIIYNHLFEAWPDVKVIAVSTYVKLVKQNGLPEDEFCKLEKNYNQNKLLVNMIMFKERELKIPESIKKKLIS